MYNLLEKYNLEGVSSAEAAQVLNSLSGRDLDSADIRTFFREQLLWYRDSPITMTGSIQVALDSLALPAELNVAMGELFASLYGDAATRLLTATRPDIAVRIKSGIDALLMAGIFTAKQHEGFYALGGGLLYNVTSEEIDGWKVDKAWADIATAQEDARLEAEGNLRDELESALNLESVLAQGDRAVLISALRAALTKLEG